MRQLIFLTIISFSLFGTTIAQEFSKIDKSPLDVAYYPEKATKRYFEKSEEKKAALSPIIKIYYSRPSKKDREIFGKLVPFGKLWRTGANETTEITFYKDVKIGEKLVRKGNYTLASIPNKDSWKLVISNTIDSWGVYVYDRSSTVAEVSSTSIKTNNTIENFSITFYEKTTNTVHLKMGWDDTIVEFPIEIIN